ncbi:MAG: hypothetical protein EYC70_14280 [Planctomycetota bacterium]|nr:MAG: hypothetical protein EYC70_14280 [Planctomycetota bacterium]
MQARHLSFLTLLALSAPAAAQDFNNDGYDDLVIGVPDEDIGSIADAGAVHVLYGSASGPILSGFQTWSQDASGVNDSCEAYDRFGYSLACGDFNNDGYDDLAIGVPYEDIVITWLFEYTDAGMVQVLYGGPGGLSASGNSWYTEGSFGTSNLDDYDNFGFSLAAGNFDRPESGDDFAVGAPNEDIGSIVDAGAVFVIYSSQGKGQYVSNEILSQDMSDVPDTAEAYDHFGYTLAASHNLPNIFHPDILAIGVPYEDIGSAYEAGAVSVHYGEYNYGVNYSSEFWTQDRGTMLDVAESFDNFGQALAWGRFHRLDVNELAVGVPGEDLNGIENAGAVAVIPVNANQGELTSNGNQLWSQDSAKVLDACESGDLFGFALAAGDFNEDGLDDLAIGVPFEDINGLSNPGAIAILFARSTGGLGAGGNQFWYQGNAGMPGMLEAYDNFGDRLAAGDVNGDGRSQLIVGVRYEDIGTVSDAGAVFVLADGPAGYGTQIWDQGSLGSVEAYDHMGGSVQ